MAGTGRRGPAPKDPEIRQNRNRKPHEEAAKAAAEKAPKGVPSYVDMNPTPPEPREKWHPVARAMYDSLLKDPARLHMSSGDWALWMLTLENVSRDMYPQVVATIPATVDEGTVIPGEAIREKVAMNGSRMANVLKLATLTGLTDGARRSIGIHLTFGVTTEDIDGPVEDVVPDRASLFLVTPDEETA